MVAAWVAVFGGLVLLLLALLSCLRCRCRAHLCPLLPFFALLRNAMEKRSPRRRLPANRRAVIAGLLFTHFPTNAMRFRQAGAHLGNSEQRSVFCR